MALRRVYLPVLLHNNGMTGGSATQHRTSFFSGSRNKPDPMGFTALSIETATFPVLFWNACINPQCHDFGVR